MVDEGKRSVAAASDLDARFGAMRLEDPSSSRVPVAPNARAEQLEKARQHYRPQPRPPSYAVEERESSVIAEYGKVFGSSGPMTSFASLFGPSSPRINPLTAEFPSVSAVAPFPSFASPSMPPSSSTTNHYCQPTASVSQDHHNLGVNPYASAPPAAMPAGLGHNPSSLINPYAGVSQPRTAGFPAARYDNDRLLNRYASAPPAAMPATGLSLNPYFSAPPPPVAGLRDTGLNLNAYASAFLMRQLAAGIPTVAPRVPTLQDVRARLLRGPMNPDLVVSSPQTAAHVVALLQERSEEVRRSVLAGVVGAAHAIMECREGHDVFITLLQACAVCPDELCALVRAVCSGQNVLKGILSKDHGARVVRALIMAVAPYHQLCQVLIYWLLSERLTEHGRCGDMLNHCFATMPYEICSIMIQFAIRNIHALLSSSSGSVYLAECFTNARGDELGILEGLLLTSTTEIATGQYSNYFMQRAIAVGREDFKERVTQRVAAEVAALAGDKFGSYVVEACFLLTCSLTPMRCVLNAFLSLPTEQLAEMVKGDYANYIVHKLLVACKTHFPKESTALARRIEKLPAAVHRDMRAQRVMLIVRKQFSKKPYH